MKIFENYRAYSQWEWPPVVLEEIAPAPMMTTTPNMYQRNFWNLFMAWKSSPGTSVAPMYRKVPPAMAVQRIETSGEDSFSTSTPTPIPIGEMTA